jgi:hypothetical protein
VITRLAGILCDWELLITELPGFEVICDQHAIILNASEICSDEQIITVGTRVSSFDIATEVTRRLNSDFDISALVSAKMQAAGDLLVLVIDPELFSADTRFSVSRAVLAGVDLQIAISGRVAPVADAGIVVFGPIQRLIDLCLIAGGSMGLSTDASAVITNVRFTEGGIRLAIAGKMVISADTAVRILSRMTPDADMVQTIYALLIRECHTIQV